MSDAPQDSGKSAAEAVAPTSTDHKMPPAAQRALAEAEARRRDIDARAAAVTSAPERNGRGGLEPVRYDDWEIDGRAVDF